ncbi:MAG: GTP-binding protein [Thermoprotei archaeon]
MDYYKIALLGNKDHGKSTLLGSLLMETGSVSQARINEAKRVSAELGRPFEPGFILDSFSEEREQAMTFDTTRAQLSYRGKGLEFIDVPGHEELMSSMLSGASYADTAVLLVSAARGEGVTPQTKRHVFIAKLFGVRTLIVAVNKMDTVNYSVNEFQRVVNELSPFLEKIGFAREVLKYVPISAYHKENLSRRSSLMEWYQGPTLLEVLSEIERSTTLVAEPTQIRVFVQGQITASDVFGGKLLSGELVKDAILKDPVDGAEFKVNELWVGGKPRSQAHSGESVALKFSGNINGDLAGRVLCDTRHGCRSLKEIDATLFVLREPRGALTLSRMGWKTSVSGLQVHSVTDTATGERVESDRLLGLQAASVTLYLRSPSVFEPFSKVGELGRFALYDQEGLVAAGVVADS